MRLFLDSLRKESYRMRNDILRLFIALDLPSTVQTILYDMACEIKGGRPVPRDQLHLTLKFIGDIEKQALISLKEALMSVRSPEFYLNLIGVGIFPPRGTPRIVWAGISQQRELVMLQSAIESTLASLGYAKEERPFSPHITLVRLKTLHNDSVKSFLVSNKNFRAEPCLVPSFKLYSSRLTDAGAIHRLEAAFPLEKCV
jgi:RNA 2',3'-cyclic 3'-phosphodiesterase